uniref:Uncharacterized protein n=1 Tax=Nicotiana tabacum TaxID=4097 RepID=A0A1S3ZEP6_TOBAC|nr:PREDICTED: uncharacterized protein LOC107785994 [Nicotiana tabacum]
MGGMRLLPEESDVAMVRTPAAATDLISDDDRSVAADSWSIKSEYGSTLDDEQRHADATEALAAVNYRAASDYSSDKEEQDAEGVSSMLGFQSYWDSAYADELANFREHVQNPSSSGNQALKKLLQHLAPPCQNCNQRRHDN